MRLFKLLHFHPVAKNNCREALLDGNRRKIFLRGITQIRGTEKLLGICDASDS